MEDRFKKLEDEYFRLKGQFAAGRITREQLEASLKQMMVQDEQGRYWSLGVDDAKWYVHDGVNWTQGAPPGLALAVPPLPSRTASHATSRVPLLLVLAGVILVLVVLAVVFGGLYSPKQVVVIAPFGTNTPAASVETPQPGLAQTAASVETPQPGLAQMTATTAPSSGIASSKVPGVNVSIVPVAIPPPIRAKDFAALNTQLADKIAALNQAELKFIRDIRASASVARPPGLALPSGKGELTDQDIKDMAGEAMDVAVLADQLGDMATKQDKGSAKAGQSADAFYAIARNAFSLVIDAQNVRTALESGLIPGGQAIQVIADYGTQLWNTAVTDGNTKGNPFSTQANGGDPVQSLKPGAVKQVQSQINADNSSIWIAQSSSQKTRTVNVPAAQSPAANPFDPQLRTFLTTADGQTDGNKAEQVAAANLQALGAKSNGTDPSQPAQLQVPVAPVAVSGGDQIKAGNIPTFKSGKATVVSKNSSGDENPFMQSLGMNGDGSLTDGGKTSVEDAPALVSLTLSNITIDQVNQRPKGSGTFEADVNFSYTVNWSTTMASPQFKLACNSSHEAAVAQPSGSANLTGNGLLILYPGTLTVYCYANSTNGQSLGSVSVTVLVGDAAGATQRAVQVETDSAALDATLTAEAMGTTSAQQTQSAQTVQAQQTIDAVSTEVAGTETAEFKMTASAAETKRAQPPPASETPTSTPTFTPKVVDTVFHAGDVFSVNTKVVLERGRLYRFTFSGLVNLINPTRSVAANILDHVNGVAVPASGIVVLEGTGSVATISCGSGEPDPNDPGGYTVVVEDLGPS